MKDSILKKKSCFWVECLLPLPINSFFTYELNHSVKGWDGEISPLLKRVWLNFNNRKQWGLIVRLLEQKPAFDCKSVIQIIDAESIVDTSYIKFLRTLADFYICSLGEAMVMALPSGKRVKKQARLVVREELTQKAPAIAKISQAAKKKSQINYGAMFDLSERQKESLQNLFTELDSSISNKRVSLQLLYGITGSGKTEVYFRLIEKLIKSNKDVILLVPEIGLSVKLLEKVRERFKDKVALYHSRLSKSERLEEWYKVKTGSARLAVGTRSAVFLPFQNLALIILDEEHESFYKEHSTPRYHARQVAQIALKKNGGMILLGSATPAIETYYWAKKGRIGYHNLPDRVTPNPRANVELLDLSEIISKKSEIFSPQMIREIHKTLDNGNQIILFLNRRGYSPFVKCFSCKQIISCPNCEISLSFHKTGDRVAVNNKKEIFQNHTGLLKCHYCGHQKVFMNKCPYCNSLSLRLVGSGIQKVEEETRKHFPEVRIERLDLDAVQKKSFASTLESFENGDIKILLGTQMIAKGLDLPNVTFVGVLMADIGLSIPDFRANERTFSLLTQVAGRAGRGEQKGKVLIQTFQKDNPVMQYAMRQDYNGFFEDEILQRKRLNYPPFRRLLRIVIRGRDEEKVIKDSNNLAIALKKNYLEMGVAEEKIPLLGPVPAAFYRINNNFRYHFLIKESSLKRGLKIIRKTMETVPKPRSVYREIDIDPLDIL